jgi:fucose permease
MRDSLRQDASRTRNALWALFFLMGIVSMAWVPRIPEIKRTLDLSDGGFGLVLISSSLGAALGAQFAGRLIHRFGSKAVTRVAQFIMPAGLVIMSQSNSVEVLVLGLFTLGAGYSSVDVSVNSQAVVVEKLLARRYMSSFHGAWSAGAFVTTAFGGLIANVLTPGENLLLVSIIAIAFYLPATKFLLGSEADEHQGANEGEPNNVPWTGKLALPLWIMGIGSIGALIAEGSASDWGGILLEDHLGINKGLSASAFAAFAFAMIISRFVGDLLYAKFGMYESVAFLAIASALVWLLSIMIAWQISERSTSWALAIVIAGFFIAGFGIGPVFPAFMLAAGTIKGVPASVGIARVALLAIAGYFVGPTITGLISEMTSLPIAMIYPVAMLALGGLMALRARDLQSAKVGQVHHA